MMKRWMVQVVWFALLGATVWAQPNVSLRERVAEQFVILDGRCGVEFGIGTRTYVAFGQDNGFAFYRYEPGNAASVRPVGTMMLTGYWPVYDLDEAAGTSASRRMLASAVGGVVMVFEVEEQSGGVLGVHPYGVFSGVSGVQRVQIEPLGAGRYLVAAGLASGELVVWDWSVPAQPVDAPERGVSLTPVARLQVDSGGAYGYRFYRFENGVRALRVWRSGDIVYVALGGRDGVVWFGRWSGSGVVAVGKAQLHPSGVVELAVVGSRLAVGLENGLVYVYGWSGNGLGYQYTLKEPYAPLGMHSLCALSGDRLAVATAFVRVYHLAQTGALGGTLGGFVAGYDDTFEYYWFYFYFPHLWALRPVLYDNARVLPSVSANGYFVKLGDTGKVLRADFLEQNASYAEQRRQAPVYTLTYGNNLLAEGHADGRVIWGSASQSFGEPVFAIKAFQQGSDWWLIGSYGVGKVFAWRSGQAAITNILPSSTEPRIIYAIDVVSATTSEMRFVTASGDGRVEFWAWNYTNSAATQVGNAVQLPRPLHTLSINAGRNLLAASSLFHPYQSYSQARSWLMTISSSGLSGAQIIQPLYTYGQTQAIYPATVVFHPRRPDMAALSSWKYSWVRFFNADGSRARDVLLQGLEGDSPLSEPRLFAWIDENLLAAAAIYRGVVSIYATNVDSVMQSQTLLPHPNWARGIYDRALQNVYEPHKDRVYSIISIGSAEVATSGADGRVVRWTTRVPIASSWASSWLTSLDFSPYDAGELLFSGCYRYTPNRHAVLWSTRGIPVLASRVPNASANFRARALVAGFAQDITTTDVFVNRYIRQEASGYDSLSQRPYPGRVEASEDGAWVLTQIYDLKQGTTLSCRFYLTPHDQLNTVQTPQSIAFTTTWTAGDREYETGSTTHATLAPSGNRLAVCAIGSAGIRVYDRTGSGWNFSTFSSVVNFTVPVRIGEPWVKFVADDVLLVWYYDASPNVNRHKLEVYQWSGGSWTLRQTLDNVPMPVIGKHQGQLIDVIPVGASARVALLTSEGLRFYRLDRSGGVATLVEVGRSERAANGFLNVLGCSWVRFSRQNPNLLATANGRHAVVYDLTGLFSW